MDHLTCFLGGLLALGAKEAPDTEEEERNSKRKVTGEELTRTCREMYARTPTGLGAERVAFSPAGGGGGGGGGDSAIYDFKPEAMVYILRPEAIESHFVLWRLTHEQKYRDWGWEAFSAIETHCKHAFGYHGIRDVTGGGGAGKTKKVVVVGDGVQQSFFLAETLKYLYLLYCEDDVVPLDRWVFNTEAHPFPIFRDDPEEWMKYMGSDKID